MSLLAQAPGVGDNRVLDQWTIPFGEWVKQMVGWIDQNLGLLLSIIEWPFTWLFRNLVRGGGYHPWWQLEDMPWIAVCAGFFVVGTLTRNARVGFAVALALAGCGLLGNEYWEETAITVGMIIVAVVLCAIIGIPVGILCGRFDGVWNAVRPVLDAMQVVHAFVYMLPIIFFWGIGPEPATMVTMVFALPPLIRLTNLGVRQVPGDVVEASRAYGASELRVLLDVQLPLARSAIMTGLNQTLLLSISMLGIAAIMGAGGLGLLVFRAVQNLDTALAASAGLALFLVAVVLDRISQTADTDGMSLLVRLRRAWAHRRDPEELLPEADSTRAAAEADGRTAPLSAAERIGARVALVGATVGAVSVFLTWSQDSGLVSGYGRRLDEDLGGQSFNGFDASGGSFFGMVVFGCSVLLVAASLVTLTRPGRISRWYGADGAMLFATGSLATSIAYLWAAPSDANVAYSDGVGAWLALVAGIAGTLGAALWLRGAPYTSRRPLRARLALGRIFTALLAIATLVMAGFSGWSFDERPGTESGLTAEAAAQIEELKRQATEDPSQAAAIASKIITVTQQARRAEMRILDGFTPAGAGLGYLALIVGVLGALCVLPGSGVFGHDERFKWIWSVVTAGAGLGVMLIAAAWIASLLRVSEPEFVSGAGAFLCFTGGFLLAASSRSVLNEFERSRVFLDTEVSAPAGSGGSKIEVKP